MAIRITAKASQQPKTTRNGRDRTTGDIEGIGRPRTTAPTTAATRAIAAAIARYPKGLARRAAPRSPCAMDTQERVRPQPGHGRPVMRRNGQTTGPLSTRAGLTTHAIASAAE